MKALLTKLEIEDLPDNGLRELAKTLGVNVVKELFVKCPGITVYIPKTWHRLYIKKYIKRHFTGNNYEELARDLGVTKRTIFRHIR